MTRLTAIIDEEILILENELKETDNHVIKTATLKDRVMRHIQFDGKNEETQYCAKVGFSQTIQMRLWVKGYRSLRTGFFINLDNCENVPYLQELLANADLAVSERERVKDRIKSLRDKKLSGQIEFDIAGNVINGLTNPLTESELMELILDDAI